MARLFASPTTTFLLLASSTLFLTTQAHEKWPGSFTCPATTTTRTTAPALGVDGLCACAAGWAGPECGVCTEDKACEAAVGKGATCSLTSFAGTKSADGFCQISTDSVKDLLHGTGFVQMKYEASQTPADGSEFSFTFIKRHDDTNAYVPLFRCQSDKTTVETNHGTGMVTYTSPDLACELVCEVGKDRSCSNILGNVVKTVGTTGGSSIVCDPFTKECEVKEMILDTFITGGVKTNNCQISECLAAAPAAAGTKPAATKTTPPKAPGAKLRA